MTARAGPEPTVTRLTPSAAGSDTEGAPGTASTLSGPAISRTSAEIVSASPTPGTKTQSSIRYDMDPATEAPHHPRCHIQTSAIGEGIRIPSNEVMCDAVLEMVLEQILDRE